MFSDGSSLVATVPLSGNAATYTAPFDALGSHIITASFVPANANFSSPVSPASLLQQVQPMAIESDPATGRLALYVGSTAYNDVINISVKTVKNGNDQYSVQIDTQRAQSGLSSFKAQGAAQGTIARIVAFGVGSSDVINVNCGSSVISELFGGNGLNSLRGGDGNNVLVGGSGVNVLGGGSGRNILIAGTGLGVLAAGSGDTILIAGSTKYDTPTPANLAALDQIMAEWGSSSSLATREAHLAGVVSGGLNGNDFLNGSTVHDDGFGDVLVAGNGAEWFFVDLASDIVLSKKSDKITNIRGW